MMNQGFFTCYSRSIMFSRHTNSQSQQIPTHQQKDHLPYSPSLGPQAKPAWKKPVILCSSESHSTALISCYCSCLAREIRRCKFNLIISSSKQASSTVIYYLGWKVPLQLIWSCYHRQRNKLLGCSVWMSSWFVRGRTPLSQRLEGCKQA